MTKNKYVGIGFLVISVLVLIGVAVVSLGKKPDDKKVRTVEPIVGEMVKVAPTITEERREIVAKLETKKVTVTNGSIDPREVTIKPYDQVVFINSTEKSLSFKGEGWGGIPIKPGRNMTNAFDKVGTFAYEVPELGLKGTVTVVAN